MTAPKYITQGLKAINSLYFAVYNPKINEPKNMSNGKARWQIRKWTGNNPKKLDLWNCYGYSEVIMTICKEAVTDEGLIDIDYQDLDVRVLTAIKKSDRWKEDYKRKIEEIDWNNESNERKARSECEYQSKYIAKKFFQQMNEPTVFLSGKEFLI